jgi:hypothetical protein
MTTEFPPEHPGTNSPGGASSVELPPRRGRATAPAEPASFPHRVVTHASQRPESRAVMPGGGDSAAGQFNTARQEPSPYHRADRKVRFSAITDPVQRAKILLREQLVLIVAELTPDHGKECALSLACARLAELLGAEQARLGATISMGASKRNLLRWCQAYEKFGLDGLVEQKLGHSGAKPLVIPPHILDQTAAAALEHGRLGPAGRANIARAVRNVMMTHPDRTPEMAERIHGGHASKSYVPKSILAAVQSRMSPLVTAAVQGPHALRMAAPFTPGDYSELPAGRAFTADDMTSNVVAWCPAPTQLGYIIGQPQILAFADVGSQRWLLARCILRPSGAYTRDDVWGGIGDVFDQFGLYSEAIFEGGIWRSNKILGERTGLSDEDRFGGLKSLGVILHHSLRPRSKPIEGMFDRLQSEMDRCPGYIGREQRYDAPERARAALEACRAGKLHPAQAGFLRLDQFVERVDAAMALLNAERMDGMIHRGMCPDEKWAMDRPEERLKAVPAEARWMYRSAMSAPTVRRDGMLRITEGSGKYAETHYYFLPPELHHLAGRTVLVYWNDRNPEADAAVMLREDKGRLRFIGMAGYVRPMTRLGATQEQHAQARARETLATRYAMAQTAVLKPHFQRTPLISEPPAAGRAQALGRANAPAEPGSEGLAGASALPAVSRIGAELAAAADRAEAAEARRDAEAAELRRHGPALAAELLAASDEGRANAPAEPSEDPGTPDFLTEITNT